MDLDIVAKIVSLLGVAGIGGFLATLWKDSRQRKDRREELDMVRREKLDERQIVRYDGFRTELRNAYAQFLAAQSKLLKTISQCDELATALGETVDEVSRRQPTLRIPLKIAEDENPQLFAKYRAVRDIATITEAEAAVRLTELLLLEDNTVLNAILISIFESPLKWSIIDSEANHQLVETQIAEHEKKLRGLVSVLAGEFAPAQWNKRANPCDTPQSNPDVSRAQVALSETGPA